MWIFLVMMTIVNLKSSKRVRKEPEHVAVVSTCEQSESELDPKLSDLRQRRRVMPSVDATGGVSREKPQTTSISHVGEGSVPNTTSRTSVHSLRQHRVSVRDSAAPGGNESRQGTQPTSVPLDTATNVSSMIDQSENAHAPNQRRRGPNINRKAKQILENQPSVLIKLTRDVNTTKFIGDSATIFATEVGIVMRSFCPMEFHTWEKLPKENKDEMVHRLHEKIEIPHEDKVLMGYVDDQMRRQWKHTRNALKDYWQKNGGMTDPQLARSKMKPNCRTKEDWNHMCDYWESDKAQKYAEKMKDNRAKLVIPSRGGSRSIANHRFAMINKETQLPPSPIDLYHTLHFNLTKGWINDDSRIQYENIIHTKEEECNKLASAGTIITPEMEYDIEKKGVKTVCAKHKTLLSGWEASSGPVMRKKDIHSLSAAAEGSQAASKDEEDMKTSMLHLRKSFEQTRRSFELTKRKSNKVKKSLKKCYNL